MNQTHAHIGVSIIATLFFAAYYFFEPTQSNGTYLTLQNILGSVGSGLAAPFGNIQSALIVGGITAFFVVYGILGLMWLLGGRGGKVRA